MLPLAGTGRSTPSPTTSTSQPLFEAEPEQHAYLDYRRWAFESARSISRCARPGVARQRGRPRAAARDVRRLGWAGRPAVDRAAPPRPRALPWLRFKLDARPDWRRGDLRRAGGAGCVDSIDLKGQYTGTSSTTHRIPELYRQVSSASRTRGSRIRRSRRRPRHCSSRRPTASPGMRRSTPSTTSRPSAGRRRPST